MFFYKFKKKKHLPNFMGVLLAILVGKKRSNQNKEMTTVTGVL